MQRIGKILCKGCGNIPPKKLKSICSMEGVGEKGIDTLAKHSTALYSFSNLLILVTPLPFAVKQ